MGKSNKSKKSMQSGFVFTLHQFLGIILCPFFVLWFVSGYFMMFSGFPRVTMSERLKLVDTIGSSLSVDTTILVNDMINFYRKQKGDSSIVYNVNLKHEEEKYLCDIMGNNGSILFDIKSRDCVSRKQNPTKTYCRWLTDRLVPEHKAITIDTLYNLDRWIPFERRMKDMPIYKIYAHDDAHTQIYVSSKDGALLQVTTRTQRIKAYLGAIPHWIYFTPIRRHVDFWSWFVIIIAALGCIMIVAGIVVGIKMTLMSRSFRRKKWSPYKKKQILWWHHILGLFFFIPILTWTFSGLMSLASLPHWIAGDTPPNVLYRLNDNPISATDSIPYPTCPSAKQITVTNYCNIPIATIYSPNDGVKYLMLYEGEWKPLYLQKNDVMNFVESHIGTMKVKNISLMTQYNTDYLPHAMNRKRLPLPVYRLEIGTNRVYISPIKPLIKVANKATVLNDYAYGKLHSLRFVCLVNHPVLWLIIMFTLLTGGTLVSITGFILAIRWVIKYIRRRRKR